MFGSVYVKRGYLDWRLSLSVIIIQDGALAEWLGNGLQNRVHGFESRRCLHICLRADGGIGRHERLKISWPQGRAGSSPALRTKTDEDSTC